MADLLDILQARRRAQRPDELGAGNISQQTLEELIALERGQSRVPAIDVGYGDARIVGEAAEAGAPMVFRVSPSGQVSPAAPEIDVGYGDARIVGEARPLPDAGPFFDPNASPAGQMSTVATPDAGPFFEPGAQQQSLLPVGEERPLSIHDPDWDKRTVLPEVMKSQWRQATAAGVRGQQLDDFMAGAMQRWQEEMRRNRAIREGRVPDAEPGEPGRTLMTPEELSGEAPPPTQKASQRAPRELSFSRTTVQRGGGGEQSATPQPETEVARHKDEFEAWSKDRDELANAVALADQKALAERNQKLEDTLIDGEIQKMSATHGHEAVTRGNQIKELNRALSEQNDRMKEIADNPGAALDMNPFQKALMVIGAGLIGFANKQDPMAGVRTIQGLIDRSIRTHMANRDQTYRQLAGLKDDEARAKALAHQKWQDVLSVYDRMAKMPITGDEQSQLNRAKLAAMEQKLETAKELVQMGVKVEDVRAQKEQLGIQRGHLALARQQHLLDKTVAGMKLAAERGKSDVDPALVRQFHKEYNASSKLLPAIDHALAALEKAPDHPGLWTKWAAGKAIDSWFNDGRASTYAQLSSQLSAQASRGLFGEIGQQTDRDYIRLKLNDLSAFDSKELLKERWMEFKARVIAAQEEAARSLLTPTSALLQQLDRRKKTISAQSRGEP